MIRYIIVDDETVAHDIIKGYGDALPYLELVHQCYDAIEAMEFLRKHQVDLIFLDLNMPKLQGFDFLKTLHHPPQVIVTTAYQEYALEGYELNITDYLLKPFGFERFLMAINKLEKKEIPKSFSPIKVSEARLFLRSDKKLVQVKSGEVLFVESIGNYVKVVTGDQEIRVREKLSEIIKMLPENDFIQVHKSFLVAKNHIHTIEGNRILIRDYVIPVGKTYKNNVTRLFR